MFDTAPYEAKMTSAIAHLEDELKKVRTGRAHPDMLEGITIEAYGSRLPLIQAATITVPKPSQLLVTPFDQANVRAVAEAIRNDHGLGFNPSDDGRVVRVPVPALTEERRRQIAKQLGDRAEETRIALRGIRQDAFKAAKALKDAKELGEDDLKRAEKEIDRLMSEAQAKLDGIIKAKEHEVMTL